MWFVSDASVEALKNVANKNSRNRCRSSQRSKQIFARTGGRTDNSTAIGAFGGIDVLVNAAGHISTGTIENTSLEAWDDMMNINVRAAFQLMQKALPSLIERRGNIVNVSSVTGLRAFPGVLAYCVSKAALDQLTRCAALELAAKGVRVNAVNPGVVVTRFTNAAA